MLSNLLLKILFPPTLWLYTLQNYKYIITFYFIKGYVPHSFFSAPLSIRKYTLTGNTRQDSVPKFLIRSHESLIQITLKNLNIKARTSINLKGTKFE